MFAILKDPLFNTSFVATVGAACAAVASSSLWGTKKASWDSHVWRFRICNYIAVAVFLFSMAHFMNNFEGKMDRLEIVDLVLPCTGVITSLTYLLGFFGVSWVSELAGPAKGTEFSEQDSACRNTVKPKIKADQTAVIVGAGCAGSTMAITLAKQGRKVTLIERDWSIQDRIVGELLQPGGVRVLERLGIDHCAKECDSVRVDGYVVIVPDSSKTAAAALKEIDEDAPFDFNATEVTDEQRNELSCTVLKYPVHDPRTPNEFFGKMDEKSPSSSAPMTKFVPTDTSSSTPVDAPRGVSFHHCLFVQKLREECKAHPLITCIHGTVTKFIEEEGKGKGKGGSKGSKRVNGVLYKTAAKDEDGADGAIDAPTSSREVVEARGDLVVVADGIWSGLRNKCAKVEKPNLASYFVGVVVPHPPMAAPLAHRNYGHVVLADPSPILIYQISPTETRVLVDILGKMPSAANGELEEYLLKKAAPQLPSYFRKHFIYAVKTASANANNPDAAAMDAHGTSLPSIKSMPNRAMPAGKLEKNGVVMVGDAFNMRHPLTGGGMTVALRDCEALGRRLSLVEDLRDDASVRAGFDRFSKERVEYASTINVLANALHSVFSTPADDNEGDKAGTKATSASGRKEGGSSKQDIRVALRDACYEYLSLGGPNSAGPIGLLAGLTPDPSVLATHFFLVAFHAMKNIFVANPSPKTMAKTYNVMRVACMIIMPLLQSERSTVLSWYPVRKMANAVFQYEGYTA